MNNKRRIVAGLSSDDGAGNAVSGSDGIACQWFPRFYDGKKMPPAVWRRLPKEY
ncbi:TPA: hypothetical protein WIV86_001565 [Neisseria meningitidis]|uniref:hypothetical protein n=1 Tax=Neisseria TaxID=482 RepID=UPI0018649083|nr:hypothetical protein [Neisseria lactamica]